MSAGQPEIVAQRGSQAAERAGFYWIHVPFWGTDAVLVGEWVAEGGYWLVHGEEGSLMPDEVVVLSPRLEPPAGA